MARGVAKERGSGLGVLVGAGTIDTEGLGRGMLAGARTVVAAGSDVSTLGVGTGRSGLGGSNTLGEGRAGRGVARSEGLSGCCNERGVGGGRGNGDRRDHRGCGSRKEWAGVVGTITSRPHPRSIYRRHRWWRRCGSWGELILLRIRAMSM